MKAPTPECNVTELAFELKRFLDQKKVDLVNPSSPDIQCYPPPDDDDFPEIKKFCAQMKNFFSFVDEALKEASQEEALAKIGEDGEWSKPFDEVMAQAAKAINEDEAFWKKIRDEVLPLYKPTKMVNTKDEGLMFLPETGESEWDARWQKVKIWYDPDDLPVTVVQKMVNKETGEVVSSELYDEKVYPGGLVIDIL